MSSHDVVRSSWVAVFWKNNNFLGTSIICGEVYIANFQNDSFSDYIELAKILAGKYMFQVIIKNTVLMY